MKNYETDGLQTLKKAYNKNIDKKPVTSATVVDFAIWNVAKFLGIEKPFHNSRFYPGMLVFDPYHQKFMIDMLPHINQILDHAKKYIEIHARKPKRLLDSHSEDFSKYFKAAVFGTPYSDVIVNNHSNFNATLIEALLVQLVHQMALLGLVRVEDKFVQVSTNSESLYYALSDAVGKHTAKDIAREFSSRYKLGGSRRRSRSRRSRSRFRRSRSRRSNSRSRSKRSRSRRSSRRRSRRSHRRSRRRSRRRR